MSRTTTMILLALLLGASGACKKSEKGGAVPPPAADVEEPPPPPPPALVNAMVKFPGGWEIKLKTPEGFESDGQGEFTTRGNALSVSLGGEDPCKPEDPGAPAGTSPTCTDRKWLEKKDTVLAQVLNAFASQDAAGNRIPAQTEYPPRWVTESRVEFSVVVPAGGGLLDEPSLAGGVIAFDNAWPNYVLCEWGAAMETAPTFKPALEEACKAMQVMGVGP
ncbi:MAG: hypothetical protein HY907_13425 [Deltaproteobacteria bacterium]|nr:hypothetical protein [Deltaproteobacteria bacterium]